MTPAEQLEHEIATLAAQLDAATYRLLTLIRQFDESGAWADQGALSCAHWLSWRIGVDLGSAREHVRVARALSALPEIAAALQTARLTYSKVRALTRVATADNEAALLELAQNATASQLERICRGYRRAVANPLGDHPEDESYVRWVQHREAGPGFTRLMAQLTDDEAALVERAIEHAMAQTWKTKDVSAETSHRGSNGARRADALVALAERYLSHAADTPGVPPVQLVVHVDGAVGGGTLDDGRTLSPSTVDRLRCDAHVMNVTDDADGKIVGVGRRRRTIPILLRRALLLRDRGCRFPGCTNRLVDGHHIQPWSAGGATTLDNLLALCRRHHRYVHEYGFRVELRDGSLRFFRGNGAEMNAAGDGVFVPDGRSIDELPSAASPATVPQSDWRAPDYGEIVGALAWRHDHAGRATSPL